MLFSANISLTAGRIDGHSSGEASALYTRGAGFEFGCHWTLTSFSNGFFSWLGARLLVGVLISKEGPTEISSCCLWATLAQLQMALL